MNGRNYYHYLKKKCVYVLLLSAQRLGIMMSLKGTQMLLHLVHCTKCLKGILLCFVHLRGLFLKYKVTACCSIF